MYKEPFARFLCQYYVHTVLTKREKKTRGIDKQDIIIGIDFKAFKVKLC